MLAAALAAVFGALVAGAAFYLVFFTSRKNDEALRAQLREDLRQTMELEAQKRETDRVRYQSDLDEKRKAVETAVGQLTDRLKDYEKLVRAFEADRGQKFGSLEKGLQETMAATQKLSATTEGLRSLLDNSRARGAWGERMAEDILRASGLQENVQYTHNKTQDASATRPDFTFMLPDGHRVHMDVKFPFENYVRMSNASNEEDKARFKAEFLRDVKNRVKEVQKRDYVNTSELTLDYLILFIPNEQVYGFIHEALPTLLDEALRQKVVLCSPSTLYAVLAVIRQAFDNFYFNEATQEVLKLIGNFGAAYEKFRERFGDLGERLDKARELYEDISQTSFKRLDQTIAKIDKARKGGRADEAEPLPKELEHR